MLLRVLRTDFTNQSSVGELHVDGQFYCYTLEDVDRGLTAAMPLADILARKQFAQTAIPTGNYEVVLNWSNRFQQVMPLLLRVPGWEGVRIHSGNFAKQTEGCILLGKLKLPDMVGQSNATFAAFLSLLKKTAKVEKIHIEVVGRAATNPLVAESALTATMPAVVPTPIS
jgi:hypothetical protein